MFRCAIVIYGIVENNHFFNVLSKKCLTKQLEFMYNLIKADKMHIIKVGLKCSMPIYIYVCVCVCVRERERVCVFCG